MEPQARQPDAVGSSHGEDGAADVALLSNYKTRNLGNLALTRSVQRLLATAYGPDHLLALHRLPHPIAELATRHDLDRWAASLRAQVGSLDTLPAPAPGAYGERTPDLAAVAKEQSTSSAPRALAVRFAALGRRDPPSGPTGPDRRSGPSRRAARGRRRRLEPRG